jgi:hypothetical protein
MKGVAVTVSISYTALGALCVGLSLMLFFMVIFVMDKPIGWLGWLTYITAAFLLFFGGFQIHDELLAKAEAAGYERH